MQMTETHSERRRVRAIFSSRWGEGEVRVSPEKKSRLSARKYLMMLGQHKFAISPRGNGLDAHRTWEALLVGTIPIVRESALVPLYSQLPILVVKSWEQVTPRLLRDFYREVQAKLALFHYERLFADYWIGQIAIQRERCLAQVRASRAPKYVYDYSAPGGWVELDQGKRKQAPKLDVDG